MASPAEPEGPPNTLGLDFEQKTQETEVKKDDLLDKEKKKPYVNPERVKTGGPQRDKITEEELSERMARMREQNEKIKQRRLDVQADEEAFKKTQESERVRLAQIRKIQDGVDRTREQNAKRKLDKMQNREWDSGKPVGGGDSKQKAAAKVESQAPKESTDQVTEEGTKEETTKSSSPNDSGNWTRGGGPRGSSTRGRGRGRGRGISSPKSSPKEETKAAAAETKAD
ncbi:hypothetical protein MIND_01056800 [Mycena indigotica]|uniref:Uncharacterized protein n=1 Tax=Mycena indigotica TaxID=2126181 RepID=A0A8H6SC81_9AGAR|nr:uncharacterized protein MIND_01056800 [Mycena indigotica]KAF7295180.1 hypothetical protein MIND_01056800 [Mycena indigotica]